MFNERHTHRRWSAMALGIGLLLFAGCQRDTAKAAKDLNPKNVGTLATSIHVEGMVCLACAARVKELLKTTPGVDVVELNLEQHVVRVQYHPAQTNPEHLAVAVNQIGYKATVLESDESPTPDK